MFGKSKAKKEADNKRELFKNAQYKLDRIWSDNEKEIAEKLTTIAMMNNRTDKKISLDDNLDYADAMDLIEELYCDENATMITYALEALAKEYGYVPEMDAEEDLDIEAKYTTTKSIEGLLVDIKKGYDAISDPEEQVDYISKIDGGLKNIEIDKRHRPEVHRGEIWRIHLTSTVGRETSGYRWVIVVSNEKHASVSDSINVVYIHGNPPKSPLYNLKLTNSNLKEGKLDKPISSVIFTDINTVDKKRFLEKKGVVKDPYLQQLLKCIAKQLDIKHL